MPDDPTILARLASIDSTLLTIKENTDYIRHTLYGETGANGLSGDVRMIKAVEKRRMWQIRALFTVVGSGIVAVIVRMIAWR